MPLLALTASVVVLALDATPANAVVAVIHGRGYGVTPLNGVNAARLPGAYKASPLALGGAGVPNRFDAGGPLISHGGPVMHSVTAHVIYWDPKGEFSEATKGIIGKFFTDVAHDSGSASNVFPVAGQYTDATGNAAYSSTFAGGAAVLDATPYPASGCVVPKEGDPGPYSPCLTDEQLTAELASYIAEHGLPTGPTQQFFVLLPHKVVTCLPPEIVEGEEVHPCSNNFFCAYHGVVGSGPGEVIYSDIPFSLLDKSFAKGCQSDGHEAVQHPNGDTTGFSDVALKYISHEYIEASTDPRLNNWFDASGREIGDKCNAFGATAGAETDPNAFLPLLGGELGSGTLFDQAITADHYYIQSEWDNGAGACTMQPLPLSNAGFTASAAGPGSPVTFNATASDPYGGLSFTWNFGDGASGAGSSPSHAYATPGVYAATMTATDRLTGSTAPPVEHAVLVNDQPSASFTISPNPAAIGSSVAFNGSASSDPDGSIASYAWSFGDGAAGSGATASHAYAAVGSFTVTLTVTDSAGLKAATSQSVSVNGPSAHTAGSPSGTASSPYGKFSTLSATVDQRTGAITLTASIGNPGTLSWLATFQNGKFGVFAARLTKCKRGFIRLAGRCRPARVLFAKGSKSVASPGRVSFTLKPTASAMRALRNALRRKQGLPITVRLTLRSSGGGSPVSHTLSLTVKLKKR